MVKFEPFINILFIFSLVMCTSLVHFSIEDRRSSKLFLNTLPTKCITNSTAIPTGIIINPYIYKCMSDRFIYRPAFSYRLCGTMCISHLSCGIYDYNELCSIVLNMNRTLKLSIIFVIGFGLLSISLYIYMINTFMDGIFGLFGVFIIIYTECNLEKLGLNYR